METKQLSPEELIKSFPAEFFKLSPEEQSISVQIYRLLAQGQPVPSEKLARVLNLSNSFISDILSKWPGVYYDEEGCIVGYWGLAIPKMSHRIKVNGSTLYTWCAWDSLFIPQIIEKTALVESTCPVTGERIHLKVAPDEVKELNPTDAAMSFVTPEASRIRENVILNFCHYVHFFSSPEAGSKWISENEGTLLLSIDEAHYLGRKKNEAQYRDVLEI